MSRIQKIKKLIKEIRSIKEDGLGSAPTNVVGGGAIAGAGVGSQGEPGVHQTVGLKKTNSLKNKSPILFKMFKRNPPKS